MLSGLVFARALALIGTTAPTPTPMPALSELAATEASCVRCHPQIAAEWWDSQHRSAFTEPTFQAAHALEPRAFCRGCHAPQQDPKLRTITPHSVVGVGCTSCHLRGDDLPVQRDDHPTLRAPPTDADACGACHEFAFPDVGLRDADGPTAMQSTLTEHAASRFAGRACAACHMPKAGADAHSSHRFAASRSPEILRGSVLARAERRGSTVTITLRTREVGHAMPTGDLLRRLEVGAAITGRPETARRRYLARHFGNVRQSSGIVVRAETSDDRVPADGSDRVVSLDLDAADDDNVQWWVRYQRVAHQRSLDERSALIDGEVELASGLLTPEKTEGR